MITNPTSNNNSVRNTPTNSSRCRTSSAWGLLIGVALVGAVWGTPVVSASSIWKGSSAKSKADIKGNNNNNMDNNNNNNKLADSSTVNSDEPWRARKEWWKDPLALFDENDELIDPLDPEDATTTTASSKSAAPATEVEVDENFILPVEEPVPASVAIKPPAPTVEVVPQVQVPEPPPAAVAAPVAVTAVEEPQQPPPVPPAVVSVETAVAPAPQVEVHAIPQPQEQQPAPLAAAAAVGSAATSAAPVVPNVEAAVITQHSFDAVPTSSATIPAVAATATGPMAVLPVVSTTLAASTSLPSHYNNNNPYAAGINVGSMLSTIPAVKVLAVLAIGKAIITGIALPPPGIPSTENEWEALSSPSSKKNRKDDADKSSHRRDSDITVAAAATNSMLMSSSSSSSQGGWTRQLTTWFGLRRTNEEDTEKLPSARELMDEVEILRKRAETAEQERQIMEREYEKTSWQLQEAQNELSSLTSTTRYLKAQLRDNEEMMDRAIRAERRKAKEELLRLKDAMLEVVERERQAMRDELTRQAEEVQALLRDGATTKNSYPA